VFELALIILLRKVTERLDESGRGFQAPVEKGLRSVACKTEFIPFNSEPLSRC
jgi:hypothetical protein